MQPLVGHTNAFAQNTVRIAYRGELMWCLLWYLLEHRLPLV